MDTAPIDALLQSVLDASSGLLALRCADPEPLLGGLRRHAMRTGQALYLWQAASGLRSLRDSELPVPGCLRAADALRYVIQSAHFGLYFFIEPALPEDAAHLVLLRQIARLEGDRIRRVVWLNAPRALPASTGAAELAWQAGGGYGRPRLRDGHWVRRG